VLAYLSPIPGVALKSLAERRAAAQNKLVLLEVLAQGKSATQQRDYLAEHPRVVTTFLQKELPKTLQRGIDPIRQELDRLKGNVAKLKANLESLERLFPDAAQRAVKQAEVKAAIATLEETITDIQTRSLEPMETFRDEIPALLQQWQEEQGRVRTELANSRERAELDGLLASVFDQTAHALTVEDAANQGVAEFLTALQQRLIDTDLAQAAFLEVETGPL